MHKSIFPLSHFLAIYLVLSHHYDDFLKYSPRITIVLILSLNSVITNNLKKLHL